MAVLGNHDYRGDVEAQLSHVLKEKDSRWLCLRSFILDGGINSFNESLILIILKGKKEAKLGSLDVLNTRRFCFKQDLITF